jgi:hypothetical protein
MTCDQELLASYEKDISALVVGFNEKDAAGKQSLIQLLTADAHAFCVAGIRVLASVKPSAGARFLVYLLSKKKLLSAGLLDEGTCSLKEAVAAAKTIDDLGTHLQPALEIALSRALQVRATKEGAREVMRILEVLEAIPSQNSWPAFQNELMTHPDAGVRSKATLVIGRALKNGAWLSRRMMDKDPRVQANAIEALWTMDAADSRAALTAALRSPNNRVAANAALGLYRASDMKAVKAMLDMVRHPDPMFRVSGLWAIAQTEDPRFIPFLREQFNSSTGKIKLAVTRSLARIRRNEKASAEKGIVQIRLSSAKIEPDGGRLLEFVLTHSSGDDLSNLKPLEFAVWEDGRLIENYDVKPPDNPAVLVIGIVCPRILSETDAYRIAVAESLQRSLALKRPDDWWRVDRYSIGSPDPNAPANKSTFPYEDSLITQELKTRQAFISDRSHLEKVISTAVPRERSAVDVLQAMRRQIDGMDKTSGRRHLFVFIHAGATDVLDDPENLKSLSELIGKEAVTLHGVSPQSSEACADFRRLCLSTADGTFHESSVDKVADSFEQSYRHLLNKYEITYSLAEKAQSANVVVQVSSQCGSGRAEFLLG